VARKVPSPHSPRQKLVVAAAHNTDRERLKQSRKYLCEDNRAYVHLRIEDIVSQWRHAKTYPKVVEYYSKISDAALERLIIDVIEYRVKG